MLFRSRLIFGAIRRLIRGVFTSIYRVLSLFNLQLTILCLCVGAILYLTGALNSSDVLLVVYLIVLGLSVAYAVVATFRRILGLDKKKDKKEIQRREPVVEQPVHQEYQPQQQIDVDFPTKTVENETPKYFKVKGHPDYVMAEYSNRYVLYKVVNGKMIEIRIDYK